MYTITNWCTLRQYEAYYCKAVRSPNCQCLTYVPTITSCCCIMLCNTHGYIFIVRGAMVARRMQLQGCLVKRAVSWIGLETDFKMWVLFHTVLSSMIFWRTTFLWPIYVQRNNISSYTSGQKWKCSRIINTYLLHKSTNATAATAVTMATTSKATTTPTAVPTSGLSEGGGVWARGAVTEEGVERYTCTGGIMF